MIACEQRAVAERGEAGRTTAHAPVDRRVRADHRDRRIVGRVDREDGRGAGLTGLVAQQHGAGDRRTSGERPLVRVVDRLLGSVGRALVGAHPVGEYEQVAHEPIDLCLVDVAPLDRGHQLVAVDAHRSGHLQVEAGVRRGGGLVDAVPVGHDETVEAPLVAQDLGEQPSVLCGVFAGDLVVRAHDAPGARFLDGALERSEVELAERALVDVDVDGHPFDLGVVGHEVLDGDGHVV